jgi:hypothetical protein
MTESNNLPNNQPNDDCRIDHRVNRLEDTQIWDDFKTEWNQQFAEMNEKLDIIIRHVTGKLA